MLIGIDATALPPQPGGAGIYTIQFIRALASLETGYKFVIFAHDSGKKQISTSETGALAWVCFPDKNPAHRLLWEQTAFPRQVRNSGVDLLHSLHYTRPIRLPCPSVVTFHDMTFFLYPQYHTLFKRLYFPLAIRFSAHKSDALITVSNNTKEDTMRLLGVPEHKITPIPLGVSDDFTVISNKELLQHIREKYNLPQEFILHVGVVEPRKNLTLLLKSFQELIRDGSKISLVIAGQLGWMYEDVFKQVDELGIREEVIFTGYIPPEDLPGIYNLARIFVYPSVYEGFGLPPLEAMACGTPTITTDISSMPENIGDAGILVPPGDEAALTEAMRSLLDNPDLQEHLSRTGTQRAGRFTWEANAQAAIKVYKQVLEKQ